MSFVQFTASEALFTCSEPLSCPEISSFHSLRGRWKALRRFFEKVAVIPLVFAVKVLKTSFSLLGLAFSLFLLLVTLCSSSGLRAYFVNRLSHLAIDLADWLFWPISVMFCLGRLVLAATIHPAFYFHS
jgi:fatty-acid desaturase